MDVRSKFMGKDKLAQGLHEGAVEKLEMAIEERLNRLGEVAGRMPRSIEIYKKMAGERISEKTISKKKEFLDRWQEVESAFRKGFESQGDPSKRDAFLKIMEKAKGRKGEDYLSAIKGLNEKESNVGTLWLQGLVDDIKSRVWSLLPSFAIK